MAAGFGDVGAAVINSVLLVWAPRGRRREQLWCRLAVKGLHGLDTWQQLEDRRDGGREHGAELVAAAPWWFCDELIVREIDWVCGIE
ncbi:hypothetical protein M0R45_030892 [Rubus argutus]|uniref:Uncharacterized protein n=1 Tax=Rubus argutus TaxID=59490 RepID=A0AAW1WEF1_RUBAR